jgi:hypothetical protein
VRTARSGDRHADRRGAGTDQEGLDPDVAAQGREVAGTDSPTLTSTEWFMAFRVARTLLARGLSPNESDTLVHALQSICATAMHLLEISEIFTPLALLDDMGAAIALDPAPWDTTLREITPQSEPGLILDAVSTAIQHQQWHRLQTVGVRILLGPQRGHIGLIPKERLDSIVNGLRAYAKSSGHLSEITAELDSIVDRREYGRKWFWADLSEADAAAGLFVTNRTAARPSRLRALTFRPG